MYDPFQDYMASRNGYRKPDPSQEPIAVVKLDLSKTFATYVHGAITAYITWDMTDRRPCLVLVPTLKRLNYEEVRPCMVPIDNAYKWDEHTGDGAECAISTVRFLIGMGFEPSPPMCFKVTDIIREHLGDLLMCPPMPLVMQVEVATATRVDPATGKITETGITEDV